jgi:hypothetical protein
LGRRTIKCGLAIGTPIRAWHYGLWLNQPHKQAGHITAFKKFLPRRRPHMTQSGHRYRTCKCPAISGLARLASFDDVFKYQLQQ